MGSEVGRELEAYKLAIVRDGVSRCQRCVATPSRKGGEGLVCLASTTCAEGMQFLCNTSRTVRAPHAQLAQAQPQINLKCYAV